MIDCEQLKNRMWFSVVYSLIDNDTRHRSGQNVVDSRGAAEWVGNKFWPLRWRVSLSTKLYTTVNHFRFVFLPQYQRNEIFVLTIERTDSDLKVHALHYANELLVRFRLFQKLLQTRIIFRNNSKKCLGKEKWRILVIDKRTYHEKPHFDVYFASISTSKEMFFFRARAEKGIAWHIDASSVVETLIYHGKLANPIARLPAIVVKNWIADYAIIMTVHRITWFSK